MVEYLVPIGLSILFIAVVASLLFITGVMIKLAIDFVEAYNLYKESKKENDKLNIKLRKEILKSTGLFLFSIVIIWLVCLGADIITLANFLK